ncbi:carboxypeptidase-like regulatory domain-containing protein [Hymenobacter sp. 5516J-16]|uniref:carboxypeptidase-like regulatory domain-containing protein n=1 Tax=Hymenobacter sp. 5516J-16 TaxID=2932253 RepID=UPI001FD5493E|nr:carboxypeptidase-like regulatory domain-containing protein [Hymenobacter sp. 5516J-16]UOQ78383.1 carboxypeptidase-like regulatory domain-containing protein [Hymenobacter sp. 5516J-16]
MKNSLLTGAALLALSGTAWAQGPVSGTVTDARTGTPLPGATILLDGTPAPLPLRPALSPCPLCPPASTSCA